MPSLLLCFAEEAKPAQQLAKCCKLPLAEISRHQFPDRELRLTLPFTSTNNLPETLIIYRSLDRPNDKLVELLLLARHARGLGINTIILVAPYLAYMRQDIAFNPGEIVSQKVIGAFLADLFDAVITIDPHLHRIEHLSEAIPRGQAIALSGAPRLAELIAQQYSRPLLIGPDAESLQWVKIAAAQFGFEYGVCSKVRSGDTQVDISLPDVSVRGRNVVLMDDVASSGHTLAKAATLLLTAGAASVDVAITHALFADNALQLIKAAGVDQIWSTDCIAHSSNAISMAPVLAQALQQLIPSCLAQSTL
jgi:ribose-phosphate pyrophosphokinase